MVFSSRHRCGSLFLLIILGVCSLLAVAEVQASVGRLSGDLSLVFGGYSGTEGGATVDEASYFGQRYSVLYRKGASLGDRRMGKYSLALGYEWTQLSSEVDNTDFDETTGKILFDGYMKIAPGGLPFSLELFSSDLQRTRFDNSTSNFDIAGLSLETRSVFRDGGPQIIAGVFDGEHIVSGATLKLGVANSDYVGNFRNALTSMPMLLLDYRDSYVKDLKSLTPQHSRQRQLSFVSLNKRDNWLHHKVFEYHNYLDPEDDFDFRKWTLGTINSYDQRQWINLTNWIALSTDLNFIDLDDVSEGPKSIEEFQGNLFFTARQRNWGGESFTTFRRKMDFNRLELHEDLEVPLFLSGNLSSRQDWRLASEHIYYNRVGNPGDPLLRDEAKRRNYYLGGTYGHSVRSGGKHRIILEAEEKTGYQGDGEALSGSYEWGNEAERGRDLWYLTSIGAGMVQGDDSVDLEVDYNEMFVDLSLGGQASSRWRYGAKESVTFGDGRLKSDGFVRVKMRGDVPLTYAEGRQIDGGRLLKSISNAYVEHMTPWRLSNRLELQYEYYDSDVASDDRTMLTHRLVYSGRKARVNWVNQYTVGNDLNFNVVTGVAGNLVSRPPADASFISSFDYSYSPARAYTLNVNADYFWADSGGDSQEYNLNEVLTYRLFTTGGLLRELAIFQEKLEYDRYAGPLGWVDDLSLKLYATYFPTSVWEFGGAVKYYLFTDVSNTYNLETHVAMNFSKLQAYLRYAYGAESFDSSRSREDLTAQRWELGVKKIF